MPNFKTLIRTGYIRTLSFFFLFIYMTGLFRIFTPYISYQVNYNYYAKVLCENKDKPKVQCKGKCQLNKELKKSAKEESKKQSVIVNIQAEDIPLEGNNHTIPQFFLLKEVSFSFYSIHYLSGSLNHSTPPPKA